MRILVLNGPNINMLGRRNSAVYGTTTLLELNAMLEAEAVKLEMQVEFLQSNDAKFLIETFHKAKENWDGIVLNAGGLTHYAWDLRDAVEIARDLGVPTIEVHLSNIHARESFRHISVFSSAPAVVIDQICGMGTEGYLVAFRKLTEYVNNARFGSA